MRLPGPIALSLVLLSCGAWVSCGKGGGEASQERTLDSAYANWDGAVVAWRDAWTIDGASPWGSVEGNDAEFQRLFSLWLDSELQIDAELVPDMYARASMGPHDLGPEGAIQEVLTVEFETALAGLDALIAAGTEAAGGGDANKLAAATTNLTDAVEGLGRIEISRRLRQATDRLGPAEQDVDFDDPVYVGNEVVTPRVAEFARAIFDRTAQEGSQLRRAKSDLADAGELLEAQLLVNLSAPGKVEPAALGEDIVMAEKASESYASKAFQAQAVARASAAEIEAVEQAIADARDDLERNGRMVEVPTRSAWVLQANGTSMQVGDDLLWLVEIPMRLEFDGTAHGDWKAAERAIKPALKKARQAVVLRSLPSIETQRLAERIRWLEERLSRAQARHKTSSSEAEQLRASGFAARDRYVELIREQMQRRMRLLTGRAPGAAK